MFESGLITLNTKLLSSLNDKKFSMQFLPECLLEESLHTHIDFENHKLKSSYLIDLVHNLLLKYYFKKENSFNLSSIILKQKYGHLYNFYVNYLTNRGILILQKKHLKGKNSRIYKLKESVINGKIQRFPNKDKVLLKKYRNSQIDLKGIEQSSNLIDVDIKMKLIENLYNVEIDYEKSIFYLDTSIQEQDVYQKNKYCVDSIRDKHLFYHFDDYGRFHTNFTILKSFIRKNCLLIDGEETMELDIKNSQPLFLNLIINSNINQIDNQEKSLYSYLTTSGNFYDYLQQKMEIKDKKLIKQITYKILFGKNYKNKFNQKFYELFPTIFQFITDYKKERGDYRTLSYELQRVESNFLYNKVIRSILEYDSSITLITCHDSIICKKSDYDRITSIFQVHYDNEFNF